MINFTEQEKKFIEQDFEEKLYLYKNDEDYKKYFNEYYDSSGEVIAEMETVLNYISEINDNAEINKLVEACLWTTDFYVFTMRGFEGYEVMELAKEGAVRKEIAELYNKFYEAQYIEDRWRICYKG